MTTVAAKPPAPAAEKQRHRLTVGGVAALSLDTLLSAAYGPMAAALPACQLGAGS